MKNDDAIAQSPKSEKEVRKQAPIDRAPSSPATASKMTPTYWAKKIFRPTYTKGGERREVQEFYAQIQHGGRREKVALASNNADEASRKAAKLYARVKAAGWAVALAEFAPGRTAARDAKNVPTVGKFIEAATAAADVAPRSLRNYAVCFRKIVADAFGVKSDAKRFDYVHGGRNAWRRRVDRVRLDRLTPARVQAALQARITKAQGNPLEEQRARTTAASVLRQAKSLFSPNLKLPFEALPNPFQGVRVKAGGPRKYVSTIDAAKLLQDGKAELDGECWKALLLFLGAGLRKAEADCLQWQQVDAKANLIRVQTTAIFDTKSEASEGEVFVDPSLIAELEAFRPKAKKLFVLESELAPKPNANFAYYRAAATFDKLTKWLRGKGIMAHKPIHSLRKEFGSMVCASSDIHTASRQLRHAGIAITSAYYADNRRRVAPAIAAMLNPPKPETAPAAQAATAKAQ